MGSLIYELETGVRSEISFDDHDGLILPKINTAHDGLDSLIENAWRGQYDSTTDMLKHAECLNTVQDSRGPVEHPVSKTELIARIAQWRKNWAQQHGNLAINENDSKEPGQQCILGCVLYSLPTEPQLQILAERYGWSMDEELRFRDDIFIFSRGETPS
ncbi:hypothetical protein BB8028_0004g05320 [Beauveria bassiana]|uniref:Uncharacterized protein n=1 Tax=Beauveria bassiana TaxID=176275 RepID=A0A2S7YBP0_BEABA|nr:hypothetical protein BB8028_0004g05320 [Beauveria bassiana]